MYFKDVLGNTEIKNLLIKEVVANRSPHAQLFFGGDQSQQIPMALAFVTYLFCKNKYFKINKNNCFLNNIVFNEVCLHFEACEAFVRFV